MRNQQQLDLLKQGVATTEPGRRTLAERRAVGRGLRERVPRSSHAAWSPAADRPDPISLLEEQDRSRLAQFVPLRYGRMIASPFGFLRGSAVVMAGDLAATPVTGLQVQMCGDAHLQYCELCGWALARAHARSGDPAQVSGYLGANETFDRAIASFAQAYADQTERDHAALLGAAQAGRIPIETGVKSR
jgi:Uncharacterized protein conserved in bacteria (DUF2252)